MLLLPLLLLLLLLLAPTQSLHPTLPYPTTAAQL